MSCGVICALADIYKHCTYKAYSCVYLSVPLLRCRGGQERERRVTKCNRLSSPVYTDQYTLLVSLSYHMVLYRACGHFRVTFLGFLQFWHTLYGLGLTSTGHVQQESVSSYSTPYIIGLASYARGWIIYLSMSCRWEIPTAS